LSGQGGTGGKRHVRGEDAEGTHHVVGGVREVKAATSTTSHSAALAEELRHEQAWVSAAGEAIAHRA
jgi:hypothetical protein